MTDADLAAALCDSYAALAHLARVVALIETLAPPPDDDGERKAA